MASHMEQFVIYKVTVMVSMFLLPQHSGVEILTPKVMMSGSGAFMELISSQRRTLHEQVKALIKKDPIRRIYATQYDVTQLEGATCEL